MVMMEAETENQQKQPSSNQQFKVGNNKPKGVHQGILSDFNSPDMRLKKHQMNQQQMLNSSEGGNESLLSGSIQNDHHFPLNNEPVFSENSGEILEPTMKNLKRLELKNQRKDLQASLASSTIDNLLNMRSNPGSVYNDHHHVLGQPQQPQYQQIPKIGNQPIKFGGSMRGSMFGYGSMGIGQMMKSMEGGALMSRQALIKNLDQNKNDDLRSFGDTSSQGGMIPNEIENNLGGGNRNTETVQSHVLNSNPAGFGFFFKGMYTRPASLYNFNINNNNNH